MAVKKRGGLGKGLGALIATDDEIDIIKEETVPKRPSAGTGEYI